MSPGWQSNALQIASRVVKRTALAFPVFSMDRLAKVSPTLAESSFSEIFLSAITTSKLMIIGICDWIYIVNRFSSATCALIL